MFEKADQAELDAIIDTIAELGAEFDKAQADEIEYDLSVPPIKYVGPVEEAPHYISAILMEPVSYLTQTRISLIKTGKGAKELRCLGVEGTPRSVAYAAALLEHLFNAYPAICKVHETTDEFNDADTLFFHWPAFLRRVSYALRQAMITQAHDRLVAMDAQARDFLHRKRMAA